MVLIFILISIYSICIRDVCHFIDLAQSKKGNVQLSATPANKNYVGDEGEMLRTVNDVIFYNLQNGV